jgi:hypothetical protein
MAIAGVHPFRAGSLLVDICLYALVAPARRGHPLWSDHVPRHAERHGFGGDRHRRSS